MWSGRFITKSLVDKKRRKTLKIYINKNKDVKVEKLDGKEFRCCNLMDTDSFVLMSKKAKELVLRNDIKYKEIIDIINFIVSPEYNGRYNKVEFLFEIENDSPNFPPMTETNYYSLIRVLSKDYNIDVSCDDIIDKFKFSDYVIDGNVKYFAIEARYKILPVDEKQDYKCEREYNYHLVPHSHIIDMMLKDAEKFREK